jgi:hypothetical protein
MKNERQIIEVDRETFHLLLTILILVQVRGKATRRKPKADSFIDVLPHLRVICKLERKNFDSPEQL